MEFDDEYGCLICAHAPVDFTLFVLSPIFYACQVFGDRYDLQED